MSSPDSPAVVSSTIQIVPVIVDCKGPVRVPEEQRQLILAGFERGGDVADQCTASDKQDITCLSCPF